MSPLFSAAPVGAKTLTLTLTSDNTQYTLGTPRSASITVLDGSGSAGGGTAYSVAGAKHWLKADIGVSTSSGNVTRVADQSGGANDYVGGPAAPTLATGSAGINSRPAFSFDKNASQSLIGPSLASLTAAEVFLVVKPTVDGSRQSLFGLGSSTELDFYPFDNGLVYSDIGSTTRRASSTAITSSAPQLVDVVTTPTEWTMSVDGTTLISSTVNTVGFYAGKSFLGGYSDVAGRDWPNSFGTALLGEFLVFDHKLTGADRALVTSGLRERWGTAGDGTAYSVGGAQHWLKADVGVTTSNGGVTRVVDQSGRSNDYVAGPNAPSLVTGGSGINARAAFSFDKDVCQSLVAPPSRPSQQPRCLSS